MMPKKSARVRRRLCPHKPARYCMRIIAPTAMPLLVFIFVFMFIFMAAARTAKRRPTVPSPLAVRIAVCVCKRAPSRRSLFSNPDKKTSSFFFAPR